MPSAPLDTAARIVFIPSGHSSTGRVRRGPFAGRLLQVTIHPWHPLNETPTSGSAHGDSTLTIVDAETGEELGTTDCGIGRTECLGYGFYTWCVGGGAGAATSLISHTEDLISWRVINLGEHGSVNAFAVGPKYGSLSPTGPSGITGLGAVPEEEED